MRLVPLQLRREHGPSGGQAFYNSLVNQFAEWGVDFIKADDITGYPREIEALAGAIAQCGRDMALSLSPGGQTNKERMPVYVQANMLRTTTDIWDNRNDLDKAFAAWETYNDVRVEGFWPDLDMIPFGHLMLWNPREQGAAITDDDNLELSGKGHERMSGLSRNQKRTFITVRALAASPLFMGGDLPTSDEEAFDLITNREMLACNQNGVMGRLVHRRDGIDVWMTPSASERGAGWIGVFNRTEEERRVGLSRSELGLEAGAAYTFGSLWTHEEPWSDDGFQLDAEIGPDGVLFLAYRMAEGLPTQPREEERA
ncbi:hypothetical protein N6H14_05380 [Paenibacillus sp. CC-CFT747]|nr:hypothetical protein N6H14_05380 [Paenibacillus sp. CC-CFT747]